MRKDGTEPWPLSPDEFNAYIAQDANASASSRPTWECRNNESRASSSHAIVVPVKSMLVQRFTSYILIAAVMMAAGCASLPANSPSGPITIERQGSFMSVDGR
jgi:hypothetical protein